MNPGEPIPCEILENPRSFNVRLRLSNDGVLKVTVPSGFGKSRILEILEAKRNWIRRQRERLNNVSPDPLGQDPGRIDLAAFGESWEVRFLQEGGVPGGLIEDEKAGRLVVDGSWRNGETCRRLRAWLVKRCREKLGFRLEELSKLHGLPFRKMTVRIQKTRWGSCSAKKTISLNAKLAFLPANLVNYVLCHELCHTLHLNHSRAFWECLEKILPGSLALRKTLKGCDTFVPEWIEAPRNTLRQPNMERLTFYLQ
jgi:predicted metal-dependent hydrolase